jgi:quaternary ammonium compound-resistance protein SugE
MSAMPASLAWLALITAGFLDVAWAISMKYAEGYSGLGWSFVSLACLGAFVFLLGEGCRRCRSGSRIRFGPESAPSVR